MLRKSEESRQGRNVGIGPPLYNNDDRPPLFCLDRLCHAHLIDVSFLALSLPYR